MVSVGGVGTGSCAKRVPPPNGRHRSDPISPTHERTWRVCNADTQESLRRYSSLSLSLSLSLSCFLSHSFSLSLSLSISFFLSYSLLISLPPSLSSLYLLFGNDLSLETTSVTSLLNNLSRKVWKPPLTSFTFRSHPSVPNCYRLSAGNLVAKRIDPA